MEQKYTLGWPSVPIMVANEGLSGSHTGPKTAKFLVVTVRKGDHPK